LKALQAGKQTHPDFEDGLRNQMVLDAVEKASKTRRWVKVA
jgi:predicted dehydrogenase